MVQEMQPLGIKIIELESSEVCEKHKIPITVKEYTCYGKTRVFKQCRDCSAEEEAARKDEEEAKKNAVIQREVDANIRNSAISARFMDSTLSNWMAVTPEQKEVLLEVQAFLESPYTSTGLIFCGRPGTGKNHLACAAAKYFMTNLHKTALVTTVFKMVRAIKESWNNKNESQTVKRFSGVDLLVIDEVGVQFGSETEMLYLQEIINDRYEAEHPTILISNKTPNEISEFLGERIIDRFRDGGHILSFDWESYRGRKL